MYLFSNSIDITSFPLIILHHIPNYHRHIFCAYTAKMAKKRSYEEILNIDDVKEPISSTSIHGAIVTLSPVKKGRKSNFFDGMLADETSQIRLVGFQGCNKES